MKIDVSKCQEYGYELGGKHKCFCRPDLMNGEVMGYNNCEDIPLEQCYYKQLQQLKLENSKLKNTIKEMEDDLDDWVSDVSILYTYDDGKPNNLDELQCCMEHVHEEWSKYKQCIDEIYEIVDTYGNNGILLSVEKQECILRKIKEVKENE